MKLAIIIVIVGLTLVLDGVVMPGLFGIRESFLSFALLCALIVCFGLRRWVIGAGMIASFIMELMLGLYPGSVIISFLFVVAIWQFLAQIISIRPFLDEPASGVPHMIVGMGLLIALAAATAAASRIFYGQAIIPLAQWAQTIPILLIYGCIGIGFYIVIFRLIYRRDVF